MADGFLSVTVSLSIKFFMDIMSAFFVLFVYLTRTDFISIFSNLLLSSIMSAILVLIFGLTHTDTSDFSLRSLDVQEISVPWLNLGLHNGQSIDDGIVQL